MSAGSLSLGYAASASASPASARSWAVDRAALAGASTISAARRDFDFDVTVQASRRNSSAVQDKLVQDDKARNKHDRSARRSVEEIEAALGEALREIREAERRSAHMLERIKTRLYYCAESSRQDEHDEAASDAASEAASDEVDNDTMLVTMREWLGTPRAGGPRDPLALARETLQLRARLQLLQRIDERNTTSVDELLDRAHSDGLLALRACRR